MSKQQSWRDTIAIHPAAELFPLMLPDELRVLGEDIRKHGLHEPVVLQKQYRRRADGSIANEHDHELVLVDGRNRLEAMERAGFALIRDGKLDKTLGHRALGLEPLTGGGYAELDSDVDPYAFVISRNIHRRHLTAEQKRELIGKLLKVDPSKSDRRIAEMTKTDHKTVGSERTEMEGRGEIPHVAERRDTRGRKQPARKQPSRKSRKPTMKPPQGTTSKPSATPRDDIGPASTSEMARKDAEIEDLRNAKRRLEIENTGLCSEIEELKTQRKPASDSKAASRCSICHEKKQAALRPVFICDRCVATFEVHEAAEQERVR